MINGNSLPSEIEADPRFASILSAHGHGVGSIGAETAAQTLANLINWWRECLEGGATMESLLTDVDDQVEILTAFRDAVHKDATLLLPPHDPTVSAIYELDDNGEATGHVFHYCNSNCADRHQGTRDFPFPKYKHGRSADYVEGEVCSHCGKPLSRVTSPQLAKR